MKIVLSASALNGRELKELRQSLDPEVELLCMLSPLQVIYALKSKGKQASDFFKFDKFNKGWAVMTSFKND
ncbi:hypothetical protein B1201_02105 [Acinetobacter sp. ANC 5600]|nr:hypothetical protein B1201_02105 [Acinetobacter sp. ANC 5600]